MNIYEEITRLQREGKRAALATIINVRGSIPSVAAAKMLVREDGSILGTVGGGCVEADVRESARQVMVAEKPRLLSFNLNQLPDGDSGLICGGALEIFVEPVLPPPSMYIFGAGHVGNHLYRLALLAGFSVTVVDDREIYANRERFPEARDVYAGDMDQIMAGLTPSADSYIVIVTRGHRHDLRVLRWAVDTDARYIGMLGSGRKVVTIYDALEQQCVPAELLKKVYAPIGLDLGAVTPEEIALSIIAEVIALRRKSKAVLPHLSNRLREEEEHKKQPSAPEILPISSAPSAPLVISYPTPMNSAG